MRVKYLLQCLMIFSALVRGGSHCLQSCRNITLNIQLGSQMLLPCTLLISNETKEAKWSHNSSLLNIGPNGTVKFDDPRDGKIIVFPYLFYRGNFSILVHQLQASDMGMYCCQLSQECQRVEVKLLTEGLNFSWYYIAAGVGIFILLVIVFSLVVYKLRGKCSKRSSDSYYINTSPKEQRTERTQGVENVRVDECDGEYEDIQCDTHDPDYENTTGDEHDGQYEDTVSEEQDEDYVNIEGRNSKEQSDDIHSENQTEHHLERDTPGHRDVYENDEHGLKQKSKFPPKAFRKMTNQQSVSQGLYYANSSEIQKSARVEKRKKDKVQLALPACSSLDQTGILRWCCL
ncbi:uncharacterized protein LOC113658885 isoform X2 [Tachysurus fulvidraco]|uniref:uncharacterized protein LOC113658885 isoform X2 n=1 Tax=Tachysurus fulvidraco TaxID=1234273 RepID=UPI000F4F121C|nr:uncharacterized protein LOC113658885 isoform X2 [Tachysurus fulvidraco]